MEEEEDYDSLGENMEEPHDFATLKLYVEYLATKIGRKTQNLEEFTDTVKKENNGNKKAIDKLQEIQEFFRDGRRSKVELDELLKHIKDRFDEASSKCSRMESSLEFIKEKKGKLDEINEKIEKGEEEEEFQKYNNDVKKLFDETIAKFRECKKMKISLSKTKLEDIGEAMKSWEKASEVARELSREIKHLKRQLEEKDAILGSTEEELEDEREKYKEAEEKMQSMWDKFDIEEQSKTEQAQLINAIRSLLDESEKLVRNLETQNKSLNHNISEERKRVSDLRDRVSDLQDRVESERRQNRDLALQLDHIKAEYLEAKSRNEGYERDMEMITKELIAIRNLKEQPLKRREVRQDEADQEYSSDSVDDLEEKVKMKDKMLEDKYVEVQRMESDLWRYTERIKSLEEEVLWRAENNNTSVAKLQTKEREVDELTELLKDIQTKLHTEKLVKDEYIIKCEILESKLALMERDEDKDSLLQILEDEKERAENLVREVEKYKLLLQEECEKSEESTALVEDLEEKLAAETEYSSLIKTKSLENITLAEQENRKLFDIVQELRLRLTEKDNGIEELIVQCAVEELKLREEIASLSSSVQLRKRDSIFKARVIQRLRQEVVALKRGMGTLDDEEDENGGLEKLLEEEKHRVEKFEDALLVLSKKNEESENQIREKDYEFSRKSAEDGKRIAELLQEVDANKTAITNFELQIEKLEEMLSLQKKIEEAEDSASLEEALEKQKNNYATEKVKRKNEIIQELRDKIESLNDDLSRERLRLTNNEALITDLNDANIKDAKKIEELAKQAVRLEEQIDELTVKVAEGQRLISEVEGIADRERIRALALEELLAIDKKDNSKHLEVVEELKAKVENYQSNVGELKKKVDRMRREIRRASEDEEDDEELLPSKERYGPVRKLHEKLSSQKRIIQDLKANVNAVEERNEKLDEELREQRDRNDEQDEKINLLMSKSLECEDVMERMMEKLELIRERYIGLSGLNDEDQALAEAQAMKQEGKSYLRDTFIGFSSITEEDVSPRVDVKGPPGEVKEEMITEVKETVQENPIIPKDISENPFTWLPDFLHSSSTESEKPEPDKAKDEEHKDEGSDDAVYYDSPGKSQEEMLGEQREGAEKLPYDPMLIEHLIMFEQVFEKIFTEEGRRITLLLEKFQGIIEKNAEFFVILQDLKRNLNSTRAENEMKTRQINEMKDQIEDMLQKGSSEAETFTTGSSEKDQRLEELEECNRTIEELNITLKSRQDTIEYLTEVLQLEKNNFAFKEALVYELEQRLEKERQVTEQITKALEEEEERTLQLSEALTTEQVKGVKMKEKGQQLQKLLEQEENKNKELSSALEEKMDFVNQLKESIAVEQLVKSEYQNEIENLKTKLVEERETSTRLQEGHENENNARGQAEGRLQQLLEDEKNKNNDLTAMLDENKNLVNQLKENIAVEQLVKSEYENEVEKLKAKLMEERETLSLLREECDLDKNARYQAEGKLSQLEEDLYTKHKEIEVLHIDLETERKCYKIVSERLETEQNVMSELEERVKTTEEIAVGEKTVVEELNKTLSEEQNNNAELKSRLEKIANDAKYKDGEIGNLMSQLGEEKNKIDNLISDIDVEKMAKSKVEAKLREMEEHIQKDEQLFEELRETIDSENGRNRELLEIIDKERMKNLELEDKIKELDAQVLLDLQLFDELRMTIEKEREHNRELDELLQSGGGYNNRDNLLAELDGVVSELKLKLDEEKQRNEELQEDLRRLREDSSVDDMKEILNSQILHTAELKGQLESELEKSGKLQEKSKDDENKLSQLENLLKSLKEISAHASKELEDDSDVDEEDAPRFREESSAHDSLDRDLLKMTSVLSRKKDSKKKLKEELEGYKNKMIEKEALLNETNTNVEGIIKAETERVTLMMEEQGFKMSRTIETLNREVEKRQLELREREEENETFKRFYEEESQFARQKLELTNSLNKRLHEFESVSIRKDEEIRSLRGFKEEFEITRRELDEKSQRLKVTEEDLTKLQRVVQELETEKSRHEISESIAHLTDKDRQIERLIDAFNKLRKENEENEKCIFKLQDEIMRLRPLVAKHQKTAEKSSAAVKKSKFLLDVLQADVEIRSLNMQFLRQENENLRAKMLQKSRPTAARQEDLSPTVVRQDLVEAGRQTVVDPVNPRTTVREDMIRVADDKAKVGVPAPTDDVKKNNNNNQNEKAIDSNTVADDRVSTDNTKRSDIKTDATSESKDEQITRLKERIVHIATVMQKVKDDHRRTVAEKDREIFKLVQSVAVMRKLLQGLQTELKRLDVIDELVQSKKASDTAVDDATLVIEEFGSQIDSLRKDIESKTEIVKGLKAKISEVKKSNDPINKSKLRPKENVQKVLTAKLEEQRSKLKRFEKLHSGLTVIYNAESKQGTTTGNEKNSCPTIHKITPCKMQVTGGDVAIREREDAIIAEAAQSTSAALPYNDMFNESDSPNSTESPQAIHKPVLNESFTPSKTKADLPPSEWKIRLLFYVIAGAILSLLSYHVDPKHLPIIFGLIATPMLFALTTFEVSRYRKKAQNILQRAGTLTVLDGDDDSSSSLVIEQLRMQIESDQQLIDDLKNRLHENAMNKVGTEEDPSGTDEVDVIEEQKWRIITLEEHLRSLEKAKIEENELVDISFAEYKKLREEVEILKTKREKEDLQDAIAAKRKENEAKILDADIKRINISFASVPLLVAIAIALMQVVSLHPSAPFGVLLTLVMVLANTWYAKKSILTKLKEERKTFIEQDEEIDDLTELLEKEHEVVQSQKTAIDIMVREIDNEHVNLKEKRLTLAKMIWQVREMEEMRAALVEEAPAKLDEDTFKSTLKNLKEMESQLPDLPSDDDDESTSREQRNKVERDDFPRNERCRLKLKTIGMLVVNVFALFISLAYRSVTVSILIAFQLLLGFLFRNSENKTIKENELLQCRLEAQTKRYKTYKDQSAKLKRLLDAEKSLKTSDEFAKVIQDRRRKKTEHLSTFIMYIFLTF